MCREIRRKGRNKAHALKCRQKKQDELAELQRRVQDARMRKIETERENMRLQGIYQHLETRLQKIEAEARNYGYGFQF